MEYSARVMDDREIVSRRTALRGLTDKVDEARATETATEDDVCLSNGLVEIATGPLLQQSVRDDQIARLKTCPCLLAAIMFHLILRAEGLMEEESEN